MCGAVPWNPVVDCGDWRRTCRVWRRLFGIVDQGIIWGGAVSLGLIRASFGLRCIIGIGGQGVVWASPWLWDC